MAPKILKKTAVFIAAVIAALCALATAEARPLRHYDVGDPLSAFTLPSLAGQGQPFTFDPAATGRPAVIMIFTASNEFHARKAVEILESMAMLGEKYGSRTDLLLVYADDRGMEGVVAGLHEQKRTFTMLHDRNRELYNRYGVYIMPVAIVVSASGSIEQIVPYTHNMAELVEGNLRLALGDWSREQLQQMLNPEAVKGGEATEAEKAYERRLNYGRLMMAQHLYAQGAREFARAIELLPAKEITYLELGSAQLAMKDWEAARASFNAALAQNRESREAAAGLALALYHLGEVEAARPGLEAAVAADSPRPEIMLALAEIHEKNGDFQQALQLYKSALSRLRSQHEEMMRKSH